MHVDNALRDKKCAYTNSDLLYDNSKRLASCCILVSCFSTFRHTRLCYSLINMNACKISEHIYIQENQLLTILTCKTQLIGDVIVVRARVFFY